MSKATAREPGWYWIKDSAGWTAVEFDANEDTPRWRYRGAWVTAQYFDAAFDEIGPRILDPDAAASEQAELLAVLRGLSAEVNGALGLAPLSLREALGNTNVAVLKDKVAEASAALAKAEERR